MVDFEKQKADDKMHAKLPNMQGDKKNYRIDCSQTVESGIKCSVYIYSSSDTNVCISLVIHVLTSCRYNYTVVSKMHCNEVFLLFL